MSKAKQPNPSTNQEANPASNHADNPSHSDRKGFLNLAGEAFVVLGAEIVEGKDKVVKVVGEKFTTLKSAKKKVAPAKKKAAPVKKKAAPRKAAPKKTAKRKR